MQIQFDREKGTLRIDDGKIGAVYFIINGKIDPSSAILFEVGEKGRCVAFDTPRAKEGKEIFNPVISKFAGENEFEVILPGNNNIPK